jgi:hypothetical protein
LERAGTSNLQPEASKSSLPPGRQDPLFPVRAAPGVELPEPSPTFRGFSLVVNETLARKPVAETVRAFEDAVGV